MGPPNAPIYTSSKGALQSLVRSISQAYAPLGVRTHLASPFVYDTVMARDGLDQFAGPEGTLEEKKIRVAKKFNGQDTLATPDQFAKVIVDVVEESITPGTVFAANGSRHPFFRPGGVFEEAS